ncbi:MAG TPA: short-chain dehydrogenase/reductase [Stellaceae bacterium]|jgi:NAD(P)-dependent dehydrogenase (short-subunit alcohol dehydrogenase family)|nr:short-chain dehydrogenase/reductase [Stellaceae bacterium]
MELDLAGRTALVTGASKGIGRAVALALAAEGCDLVLAARTAADLDRVRDEIRALRNVAVTTAPVDLGRGDAARGLAHAFPAIDILVNNAGAIPGGRLDEIDEPRWREAWDLKVFGYINLCRAYLALMRAKKRGVIVNIIGSAGERLDAAYIAGSAGNAALMAFTRALGGAAPEAGLRVVGINPGPVATDRLVTLLKKRAQDRLGDAARWQELTETMPFGRPATPEEIAAMAVFLASDRSAYTTGTIVTIDGGLANRHTL